MILSQTFNSKFVENTRHLHGPRNYDLSDSFSVNRNKIGKTWYRNCIQTITFSKFSL